MRFAVLLIFLWSSIAFAAEPQVEEKHEFKGEEKDYTSGTTRSEWFEVPAASLAQLENRVDVAEHDPTLELYICLEASRDGGKTAVLDAKGNAICGCGANSSPGWLDKDGKPVTFFGVTCTSRTGKGQIKDLQGVSYRLRVDANKDVPKLTIQTTILKKPL